MQQPAPSLLRDPLFRNLWVTVELSFLGMFIHVVAAGWLMTNLTSSATLVALIQTAYALPTVLFSVIAGALADTFDRRRTMTLSLLVGFGASVALVVMAWAGVLTPWLILGLMFTVGAGIAIFTPSWQASLGDIAPRARLIEAVSLHNIGANVMRTIGPSAGGILTAGAGAPVAFLAGALSYLPALAAMLLWRPKPAASDTEPEGIRPAVALTFRSLAVSPQLRLLLLRVFCFSSGAVCVMAVLPLVARDQLGLGAQGYGFLYGGFGMGAILGGLSLRRLRGRLGFETTARAAFLASAAAAGVLALSDSFWIGLPATVVAGACWLIVHSIQNSVLQLATPRWIAGRMVAMFLSAAFLGLSVGGWVWGVATEIAGTRVALGLAGATLLATYLLARRVPLPETSDLAPEPLEALPDAEGAQGVRPQDGPLHVLVEHRIDEARQPEFRRLMEARRRHLTRLGARHWLLLRDLRSPGLWLESFHTAGWSDYRRVMSRRTSETAGLRAEIRALQLDGAEPAVRLMQQTPPAPPRIEPMLRT